MKIRFSRYPLIRLALKSGAFFLALMNKECSYIHPAESNSATFHSCLPETGINDLITTYIEIFSEPPWNEKWTFAEVLYRLQQEVAFTKDSFLAILAGDEKKTKTGGFSWGAIVKAESLQQRIALSLGINPDSLVELINVLKRRSVSRILYFDEFAVAKSFRGKVWPIRFLLKAGLKVSCRNGVNKTMFWSTPESKITALAMYMGYEPIYRKMIKGKEIVFLFHPDTPSLLKITCSINDRSVVSLKRITSFFAGKRSL